MAFHTLLEIRHFIYVCNLQKVVEPSKLHGWGDADDYLNKECNENLLNCISEFRDTGAKTFQGNKCKPEEVVDEISIIIQVALLTGRAIDNP